MVIDDILTKSAKILTQGYINLHNVALGDDDLETQREDIEDSLGLALQEAINQIAALKAARGHKKELQEAQLEGLHTLANIITVVGNIETIMECSSDFASRYFEIVNPGIFQDAFLKLPAERKKELTDIIMKGLYNEKVQ